MLVCKRLCFLCGRTWSVGRARDHRGVAVGAREQGEGHGGIERRAVLALEHEHVAAHGAGLSLWGNADPASTRRW